MESIGLFVKAISSAVVLSVMSISSYFYHPSETVQTEQVNEEAVVSETNIVQPESYTVDSVQNDPQDDGNQSGDDLDLDIEKDEENKAQEEKRIQEELAKKADDEERKKEVAECKKVKHRCDERADDINDSINDIEKDIALDDQEIKSYEETINKYTPGCDSYKKRLPGRPSTYYAHISPCAYVTQSTEGKNIKEDQRKSRKDRLDDYKKQLSKLDNKGECEDYKKSCR
jgi:hypothetical protein